MHIRPKPRLIHVAARLADMQLGRRLCADKPDLQARYDLLSKLIAEAEAEIIEGEAQMEYEQRLQTLIGAWTEGADLSGYLKAPAFAEARAFCNGYYTVAPQLRQGLLPF